MTNQEAHHLPLTSINQESLILDDLIKFSSSKEISAIHPILAQSKSLNIPIFSSKVEAGFASPADDFIEEYLDLNHLLVKNNDATFFVKVSGKSMIDSGIFPDDILIVDRSITAKNSKIVIANVDGDVTVKRLCIEHDRVILKSENAQHKDIVVTGELHIWGVVTSVIHQV